MRLYKKSGTPNKPLSKPKSLVIPSEQIEIYFNTIREREYQNTKI